MCVKNGTNATYWEPLLDASGNNDTCKEWSCDAPPDIDGATMSGTSLDTWTHGTTINYDCDQAKIDTDFAKSTFTLECVYDPTSDSYEWNSTEGYTKIPQCILSEYFNL